MPPPTPMSGGGPPGHSGGPPAGASFSNVSFVTSSLVAVAITLPIIATIATGLRFYARQLKGNGKYAADDWMVLVSLVICWGHSINTIVAGAVGGIDTVTIPPQQYPSLALRTLFISSFFLVTSLYTVKVSILLFYYRLFSIERWFQRTVKILIVVLTAWWFSSFLLILLSTDPVSAHWENIGAGKKRFNYETWYSCYSGLSIFFDILILCLPIPMVRALKGLDLKRKLSVLGIFWLGGFVCIAAIIRFVFLLKQIFQLTDFRKNQYPSITVAFIWAEIEPNASVIAACLPTYAPLFREGTAVHRFFRYLGTKFTAATARRVQIPRPATSKGYNELDGSLDRTKDLELSNSSSQIEPVQVPVDVEKGLATPR